MLISDWSSDVCSSDLVKPPQWFIKMVKPKQEVVTRKFSYGKLVVMSNPGGAIRESWLRVSHLFCLGLGFFVFLSVVVYWVQIGGASCWEGVVPVRVELGGGSIVKQIIENE